MECRLCSTCNLRFHSPHQKQKGIFVEIQQETFQNQIELNLVYILDKDHLGMCNFPT